MSNHRRARFYAGKHDDRISSFVLGEYRDETRKGRDLKGGATCISHYYTGSFASEAKGDGGEFGNERKLLFRYRNRKSNVRHFDHGIATGDAGRAECVSCQDVCALSAKIRKGDASAMRSITYGIVEEKYALCGVSRISYGIAAYADAEQDGTATILAAVSDITSDRKKLEELVGRCNQAQLSVLHLSDVVEDFLAG